MENINKQIGFINDLMKKHSRYTHFSGIACIITGFMWLANEIVNYYFLLPDILKVISWSVVALLAIIISTYLTVYECYKKGKEAVNLSLFSVIDKLIIICISTFVIMWIFFRHSLVQEIPSLFMLMYGALILISRNNLPKIISYYGYCLLPCGFFGLLFANYSILLAAIVLGAGHILLGIILITKREN